MVWPNGGRQFKPQPGSEDNRFMPEEIERREKIVSARNPQKSISISIPASMADWIMKEAHRRGIPVSWVGAEIVKAGLDYMELQGLIPPAPEDVG